MKFKLRHEDMAEMVGAREGKWQSYGKRHQLPYVRLRNQEIANQEAEKVHSAKASQANFNRIFGKKTDSDVT